MFLNAASLPQSHVCLVTSAVVIIHGRTALCLWGTGVCQCLPTTPSLPNSGYFVALWGMWKYWVCRDWAGTPEQQPWQTLHLLWPPLASSCPCWQKQKDAVFIQSQRRYGSRLLVLNKTSEHISFNFCVEPLVHFSLMWISEQCKRSVHKLENKSHFSVIYRKALAGCRFSHAVVCLLSPVCWWGSPGSWGRSCLSYGHLWRHFK